MNLYSWSATTPGDNVSANTSINWNENQSPGSVNDSARLTLSVIAAWIDQAFGGGVTYGGTGNAYTMTSPTGRAITAYAVGQVFLLVPNASNTGAATLAVDGLTALDIKRPNGSAVASGDLASGGSYLLRVATGPVLHIIGDVPSAASGVYQPLDATLTAIAALITSADQFIRATGTDTFTLDTVTSFARTVLDDATAGAALTTLGVSAFVQTILDDADASAVRTTLGLGTAATQNIGTSGANVPLLNGNNVFSGNFEISNAVPAIILRSTDTTSSNGSTQASAFEYYTNDDSNPNTLAGYGRLVGSGSIGIVNFVIGLGIAPATVFTLTSTGALTLAGGLTTGSNIVSDTNNTDDLGTSSVGWRTGYFATSIEIGGTDATLMRSGAGVLAVEGVDLVGVSLSQTLTNKTLTSPTINGGTIQSRVQTSGETSGTLTAASANDQITATGGITIPASVFAAGDMIVIDGGGSARTITRGSGLTMYFNGSDVASATLAANGLMLVRFRSATVCVIQGALS